MWISFYENHSIEFWIDFSKSIQNKPQTPHSDLFLGDGGCSVPEFGHDVNKA
jgi:hypothetical protein